MTLQHRSKPFVHAVWPTKLEEHHFTMTEVISTRPFDDGEAIAWLRICRSRQPERSPIRVHA